MADPVTTTTQPESTPQQNALQKLESSERYWVWKAAIRTIFCVLNIVGLGCAAYLLAQDGQNGNGYDSYSYDFGWSSPFVGAVVVFVVSFLWCLIWVVMPFVLKPPRALHPGIAVGFDLILWLAFLVAALFALGGYFSTLYYGSDPTYLADPNYSSYNRNYEGSYYLAPNDTWVYNITYVRGDSNNYHYNDTTGEYDYDTVDTSTIVRDCTPAFTTCAQQDAFINSLWRSKPKRQALELVVDALAWLGLLVHFALFVWACVDTHRYNRAKYSSKEKFVADRIIADLERKGLVMVQNGEVKAVGPSSQAQLPSASAATSTQPQQQTPLN